MDIGGGRLVNLWPGLPEYGSSFRLICVCQDCAGTGTTGEDDRAVECLACRGCGEVEVDPAECVR